MPAGRIMRSVQSGRSVSAGMSLAAPPRGGSICVAETRLRAGHTTQRAAHALLIHLLCCLLAYALYNSLIAYLILIWQNHDSFSGQDLVELFSPLARALWVSRCGDSQ